MIGPVSNVFVQLFVICLVRIVFGLGGEEANASSLRARKCQRLTVVFLLSLPFLKVTGRFSFGLWVASEHMNFETSAPYHQFSRSLFVSYKIFSHIFCDLELD